MPGGFSDSETEERKKENSKKSVHIGRLLFRVGKILSIYPSLEYPSNYVSTVDYGGMDDGGLASSELANHYVVHTLIHRPVVTLLNVIPDDHRGCASRLQLLCAKGDSKVEVLSPPVGAQPGDIVTALGFPNEPDIPYVDDYRPVFEEIAKDLSVNKDGVAVYKGHPLEVAGKGKVTADTLRDCPVIFE